MLSEHSLQVIGRYWEGVFGSLPRPLFSDPVRIITHHGGELERYEGVFALFRAGRVVVSAPTQERLEQSMPPAARKSMLDWLYGGGDAGFQPGDFVKAMGGKGGVVVGPAFIGYAEAVPEPELAGREITANDAAVIEGLRAACSETEWEHGGSRLGDAISGVFEGGQLAAVAGYEIWGGTIAHIAVVTHPAFRGRGLGRSAVAHAARRALEAGLLPQYRTLEANVASMKIGEALGFEKYATSVAVRFR